MRLHYPPSGYMATSLPGTSSIAPEGPALLDWEDAWRGGLPLQDAFHFLHVQDYLFGQRPASHAKKLNHFAHELGVSATQCRTLEIAYLAHSYLQRLTQQQQHHSDFLLETLQNCLTRKPSIPRPSFSFGRNQPTSPPESSAALQIRSAVVFRSDRRIQPGGIAVTASSAATKAIPDRIPSDVDFMVLPAGYAARVHAADPSCGPLRRPVGTGDSA